MAIIKQIQRLIAKNKDGFIFGGLAGIISFQMIKAETEAITITLQFQSLLGISSPEPGVIVVSSTITMIGFFLMGSAIGVILDELFPQRRRIFK